MLYFNPKPDYLLLSSYYDLGDVECLQTLYAEGHPIVIDWYDTDKKVDQFLAEFELILKRYDLVSHIDNLLFLILGKAKELETAMYELSLRYQQNKRVKELAALLLTFIETQPKNYNALLFKTDLEETVKLTDSKLLSWVRNIILDKVVNGALPIVEFGLDFKDVISKDSDGTELNIAKLNELASMKLVKPGNKLKSLHADFCLYLYQYLVNESNIKAEKDTLLSDKLLLFYFDILVLLKFVDEDRIESDPKDYVGAMLRNKVYRLNPHLQGNKSK